MDRRGKSLSDHVVGPLDERNEDWRAGAPSQAMIRHNNDEISSLRIDDLKQFVDKTVTVHMNDGEIAKVKVTFVDEESEDIVGAVEETSRPDRYRAACALHTFAAADIASIESPE